MKFTLKVNNRIKKELGIDSGAIGNVIDSPESLEKIAGIAIEADENDSRQADDCTAAEVIEAWARDSGFDVVKKLADGLPEGSESEPGSADSSESLGT